MAVATPGDRPADAPGLSDIGPRASSSPPCTPGSGEAKPPTAASGAPTPLASRGARASRARRSFSPARSAAGPGLESASSASRPSVISRARAVEGGREARVRVRAPGSGGCGGWAADAPPGAMHAQACHPPTGTAPPSPQPALSRAPEASLRRRSAACDRLRDVSSRPPLAVSSSSSSAPVMSPFGGEEGGRGQSGSAILHAPKPLHHHAPGPHWPFILQRNNPTTPPFPVRIAKPRPPHLPRSPAPRWSCAR